MRFTYRWGQRPLDGFTIKRGLGQGGFGEVYFAVSDGGKEVALKLLLRGRTDTELRGISNCLNFKHPNLVHLYDLMTDERGRLSFRVAGGRTAPGDRTRGDRPDRRAPRQCGRSRRHRRRQEVADRSERDAGRLRRQSAARPLTAGPRPTGHAVGTR